MVGRDREAALLRGWLTDAIGGTLRVVLVEGAAGVGKTRLVSDAVGEMADATHLSARCHRFGLAAAFDPWIEALDRHLQLRPPDQVGEICGGSAAVLAPHLSVLPRTEAGTADRASLLDALAEVLYRLSEEQPVLVILDDFHLADFSSWEGLRFLARRLWRRPLGLVLTARSAPLRGSAVAAEVLAGLDDDGVLERIFLSPLDAPRVAQLARVVLEATGGARRVSEGLLRWLVDRSLGHPLFVISLLRALVEEGSDLEEPDLGSIPETLRERIVRELVALTLEERELLEQLSVLQHGVASHELQHLTGFTLPDLADRLERLVRLGLVVEEPRGGAATFSIAHPLIQETVYEEMGGARRESLHRQMARTLRRAGRTAAAAAHYARSAFPGDEEAMSALCEAMREAEERGLYREALAVLEALLHVLPPGDPGWADVLRAMRWQSDWALGHLAESETEIAVEAMRRIRDVIAGEGDARSRGTVELHLASFLSIGAGRMGEAEAAARAAIRLFGEAGDPESALLAKNELAWVAGSAGDLERQGRLAREVVEASRRRHPHAFVQAAGSGGFALGVTGRFEEAETLLRESIDEAAEHRLEYRAGWGKTHLGFVLALAGRLEEGRALIETALATDPSGAADALGLERHAFCLWQAGDLEEAIRQVEESAARRAIVGSRRRAWGEAVGAMILAERGEPLRARRHLDRVEQTYARGQILTWSHWWPWAEGMVAWTLGELERAGDWLERALHRLGEIGAAPLERLALLDAIQVAQVGGSRLRLERLAARIEELGDGTSDLLGPPLRRLCSASWRLGRGEREEAVSGAAAAGAELGRMGYRRLQARSAAVAGEAALELDRGEARRHLETAARLFDNAGAVWWRDRCLARLERLGTKGRRAAAAVSGPSSLTERELEVARLSAAGLTAAEIGEALYISRRTVETHLGNLYPKLGVSSKRELIRRAAELGLGISPGAPVPQPDP